ncbi:efflux RND transporter periplasmic adaptor subunit [Paenibacillus sp. WQ 127069]|uniref:Efflux RND transporter periplasmic adaptor subunit n=1 Tax=Paenibacillus baimaensis TaxID=2982185 RepID=A0ABT2UTG8_9BACL|nr:efflux RND transporter periplasmic adaptor subunit [Paenibacillus sp. WQ 127069]MCU6797950.1 efflux RND transporter periplasmic adaptor subunit [Paenibacillus sp. WQ 127069]
MWKKANKRFMMASWIITASIVMTCIPGCSLLPQEEEALKPPLVKPVKENFELYEVKKGTIKKQINGVGTFAADKMQYLFYPESGGRLADINVNLGSVVNKGDVVAQLDKGEIEGKILQQELVVEKARLALEQAKDEKRGDAIAIRIKLLDMQKEEIQLDLYRKQLSKTKLISDVSGIVTFLDPIRQGDPVVAYKAILTVSDPKSVRLVYETTNTNDLVGVQIGMPAEVKVKGGVYPGIVSQIPATAPQSDVKAIADKNAKTIVITAQGLPDTIEIGNSADITIVTENREDVMIIPKIGLRSYMGRDYVQVLEGESRKELDVEKGIVSSTEVEIRKGIKEGQKVILNN